MSVHSLWPWSAALTSTSTWSPLSRSDESQQVYVPDSDVRRDILDNIVTIVLWSISAAFVTANETRNLITLENLTFLLDNLRMQGRPLSLSSFYSLSCAISSGTRYFFISPRLPLISFHLCFARTLLRPTETSSFRCFAQM